MATKEKSNKKEQNDSNNNKSVLFELEHIAINSREVLYGLLEKSLAARDKKFSVPVFSRYCLQDPPEIFVPELLAAYSIGSRSYEKFRKEIEAGMNEFWSSGKAEFRPGAKEFLAKTKAEG